jgi:hypothetical protein
VVDRRRSRVDLLGVRRLLAVIVASLALAPAALADPWDGGASFESGTEATLAQAASPIAGRPIHVRCESPTDWPTLTAQIGGSGVVGYVLFNGGMPLDYMELGPEECLALDALLQHPPAEQCQTGTQTQTTMTTSRIRVRGRWVNIRRPQLTTQAVYGPCQQDGATVYAIWTLAHEAVHLSGQRDEPTTDCWSMQHIEETARRLNVGPVAAHAMATYAASWYASTWAQAKPDYYSPECHDGGALDLRPDDANWP